MKMFDRKVPFYKAMQRIEARKWLSAKESFDQYAIDKLALLSNLDLSAKDIVNLLIGGIIFKSVRCAALSIKADSVETFIDEMRLITEDLSNLKRKPQPHNLKRSALKKDASRNCGRKGHTRQECRGKITCSLCKAKGHHQFDCSENKKKETRGVHSAKEQHTAAAVAAVTEEQKPPETQAVATIRDAGSRVEESDDDARISVIEINGKKCELSALIDTGFNHAF